MYLTIKVAIDQDIYDQIGSLREQAAAAGGASGGGASGGGGLFFDLVDHDKLPQERIFRVKKGVK